ncbi:hypothetical protein [Burkholderia oklahomensis]|uniref:hypothetical protein n=1 Tax=Burkholderia oklahomensis TaxID=342113 RepID=UPI00016A9461|nr:hypothetical protein [Burkholderia oklahomensis]QPS40487.1 hypothetical protein I6G57_19215 [Burkholderia oklahomensis]
MRRRIAFLLDGAREHVCATAGDHRMRALPRETTRGSRPDSRAAAAGYDYPILMRAPA